MNDGFGSVSVHLGADTWFTCHTYPAEPPKGPILTISTPGLSLAISNRTRGTVQAEDVQNARRLLEAVSRFAGEVERLHTLDADPAGPAENAAA